MFNEEVIQGKWKELKGAIITQWGKLTDDELEKTTGNLISISGIIQQRYGEKKEEIESKLHSIGTTFNEKLEAEKDKLKE